MNKTPDTQDPHTPPGGGHKARIQTLLPIALVLVFALYLLSGVAKAGRAGEKTLYDYDTLAKLPVSEDGRVKPLDTVARNALLMVSGKQSLKDEMLLVGEEDELPAIVWLAELMAGRDESAARKVIRIDDPNILGLMGKTPEDGKYYSLRDLSQPLHEGEAPVFQEVDRLARQASDVRDDQRTRFQDQVIGLRRKIGMMMELQAMARPFVIPPVAAGQDWAPVIENTQGEFTAAAGEREPARQWMELMGAMRYEQPQAFNTQVAAYRQTLDGLEPGPSRKAAFETGYNRFEPFVKGTALYIAAGLIALCTLLLRPVLSEGWYRALWRSGLGLLALAFVLHTAALVVRIWLQGRPPVTNLYSSAVFIGWAAVGGAIILEKITRLNVASLAASAFGVSTLIVAHNLAKDGDTMGVMQAVLDSNFWLGTHVITITLGYSATFLAGFIAILYIVLGMTTTLIDRKAGRAMTGMVYATVCFALLFSFVGTVLGGIWADQSWGRFWGWDPKENGAILIVLMNAIILHARWGNLVKERGIMVLAVGGNIITIWSWFGTNLLGVGLHSYGFMDGAMMIIAVIAANHLMVMSAALVLPTPLWRCHYGRRHTPSIAPHAQMLIGGGLLVPSGLLLAFFGVMTYFDQLSLYLWFLGAPLLFAVVAGVGQLVEGLGRAMESSAAAAPLAMD